MIIMCVVAIAMQVFSAMHNTRVEVIGKYFLTTKRNGFTYEVTLEEDPAVPEPARPEDIPGLEHLQNLFPKGNRADDMTPAELETVRLALKRIIGAPQ